LIQAAECVIYMRYHLMQIRGLCLAFDVTKHEELKFETNDSQQLTSFEVFTTRAS